MALKKLKFNINDIKTLKFQLREADKTTPVDITGLVFRFYAKDEPGNVAYTISPVTATLTAPTSGQFEFQNVDMGATEFDGFYWIEREDGGGNVDTFRPAEGTQIQVLEK